MGLQRGLAAVREAKQQSEGRRGDARRFFIKGGETAVLRFFGNFEGGDDPVIGKMHYVKRLKGAEYQACGENADEHAGCVFCYLKENSKDKGISTSGRAYFSIKDYRKYHKFEQERRVLRPDFAFAPGRQPRPQDYLQTKYPWCQGGKRPCEFCKEGNDALVMGFRYWELATGYADMLVNQQATLRGYCLCGARDEEGNGTIYTTQYLCAKCGEAVDFDPAQSVVANCSCGQTLCPNEEIACTGCEEPRRADLQDFLFRVSRIGDGQQTNYNFEPIHPVRPPSPEELEDWEKNKPDFVAICAPQASELQAATLGLPQSPFVTPGHGAKTYGQPPTNGNGKGKFKPPKLGAGKVNFQAPEADDIPYE